MDKVLAENLLTPIDHYGQHQQHARKRAAAVITFYDP